MIDDYIVELNWNIDYNRLRDIVNHAYGTTGNHQHLIETYPYLKEIQRQCPLLGQRWNIYKFPPYKGLGVHVDAKRLACINIPIEGSEESITRFYKPLAQMNKVYNEQRVLYDIQDSLEEVFNFTLKQPTLFNNTVPHSVQAGSKERVIISWGLQGVDFKQAKAALADVVIATD